jgi:hypothetical protein
MKAISFQEFKEAVGQSYINIKTHNFPEQGWSYKTVGNVIYAWAKPCTPLMEIAEIEEKSGKPVRLCLVPKEIIKRVGL